MPNERNTAQILKEIRDDIKEVKSMQSIQADDIDYLKSWKIAEDAYKSALLQVRKEEKFKTEDESSRLWLRILREIYPIIGIIFALLYAYSASKGVH